MKGDGELEKQVANAALRPGATLDGDKYRIVRLLGRGGMGSVFEAEHTRTHKRVAIKGIHPSQAASSPAAARLVREAQAAARIRHPNVVDVYDVIVESDTVFLVMEYLEGETLSALFARNDLPAHAIIALLLPAMRGVAEAHKRGVIHRDLKPDNIFLAREGEREAPTPKVLDFGISKLDGRDTDQLSLTGSGHLIGTPKYMSFEQLAGERDIDARADVYAFGVILYEGLTGQLPYSAQSFPELVYKITTSVPPPAKQLRPDLPRSLDRLIDWALARDRDKRIASMEQLIRELEPFSTPHGYRAELELSETDEIDNAVVPVRISEARSPTPVPRAPAKKQSKRLRYAVTTSLLAAAAIAAVWFGTEPGRESSSQAVAAVPTSQPLSQLSAASVDPPPPTAAAPQQEASAALDQKLEPPAADPTPLPAKRTTKRKPHDVAPPPPPAAIAEPPAPPKPVVEASEAPAPARPGFRVINPPKSAEF